MSFSSRQTPHNPLLRAAAEAKLAQEPSPEVTQSSDELLHELQVHQIELEMQNEQLRMMQIVLDLSQARYQDLYDQAPVGYLMLNDQGVIQQSNVTAATLMGVNREELVNQPLHRFIFKEDQDSLYHLRRTLGKTLEPQSCELRMVCADGMPFPVLLTATVTRDAWHAQEFRFALSRITQPGASR
jgi:PAS domain S-box-containing protein